MFTHFNIISIYKLNLKIDVVGLILDTIYPIGWAADILHGASRDSINDKFVLVDASIAAIDLGIGKESHDLVHSNDAEQSTSEFTATKIKETKVYKNLGNLKVSWEHKVGVTDETGYTVLKVNDVGVASQHVVNSTTYAEVSDNIDNIYYDDLIQIFASNSVGTTFVKNMRIKFMEYENNDP